MIAQHNQQSTSVEADHLTVTWSASTDVDCWLCFTVNTTAFSSEPRHEKDISGRTVPIRVINPDNKSEYKTYNLRNLSSHSFTDLSHLKKEIASQLGDKVSSDPCSSVGYYKGQTRFWIRDDKHVGTMFSHVPFGVMQYHK